MSDELAGVSFSMEQETAISWILSRPSATTAA
jgi:hypothetical protein